MKDYGRTYWFTWGFLILAASFAGVGGVKAAFFGGLVAALASTALTRPYQRLGARYAPLLGAVLGVLWAIGKLYCVRWTGDAEDYAFARWNIGTDIAIHAAGFAGGALLAALAVRQPLGRSMLAGGVLAAAMTAVPYGFIDWVDYRVAGPVEVVLFVTAEDIAANAAPQRRPGSEAPTLSAEERKALQESALVVDGPGGIEALDDAGRRYWPLWRKRFTYPGNRGGPVRRVIVLMPPDELWAYHRGRGSVGRAGHSRWVFNLGADPQGITVALLKPNMDVSVSARGVTESLELSFEQNPPPKPKLGPDPQTFTTIVACFPGPAKTSLRFWDYGWVWSSRNECEVALTRHSPFGDFYAPDEPKMLPFVFDYDLELADAASLKKTRGAPHPAKRDKDDPINLSPITGLDHSPPSTQDVWVPDFSATQGKPGPAPSPLKDAKLPEPPAGKKLLPRGGELPPITNDRGSNSENVDLPPAQK